MELLKQLNQICEVVAPQGQQQPQPGQPQAAQVQPQGQQPQQAQPQAQQQAQPKAKPTRQGPPPIVQGAPTDPFSQIMAYVNANPDKAQAILNYILKVRPNAGA